MEYDLTAQWFVFFKDNLLIHKNTDGTYHAPLGNQLPVAPAKGQTTHRVTLPTGIQVYTFAIDYPMAETDEWIMTGLRASFDYLPLTDYQAAGKAYQILYWDKHSRYCPVCGTATEQHTARNRIETTAPAVTSCTGISYTTPGTRNGSARRV